MLPAVQQALRDGPPLLLIRITSYNVCYTKLLRRRRLMDLGMVPGTKITADLSSPMGDPVGYRVRDSLIALRAVQAACIRVEIIDEKEQNQHKDLAEVSQEVTV